MSGHSHLSNGQEGVQGQENVAGLQGAVRRTFRLGASVVSGSWSTSTASCCCCSVTDAEIGAGSAPQSGCLWPNEHPGCRWQRRASRVRPDLRSLSFPSFTGASSPRTGLSACCFKGGAPAHLSSESCLITVQVYVFCVATFPPRCTLYPIFLVTAPFWRQRRE